MCEWKKKRDIEIESTKMHCLSELRKQKYNMQNP